MMPPLLLPQSVKRILCIGAHVDDIEIGCGGLLLRLLQERDDLEVFWAVATADTQRRDEALASHALFLDGAAWKEIQFFDLPDGYLPYVGTETKDAFFQLREKFDPQLILTHRLEDRHQDHRMLGELTWNTFRDHFILEYEIPKYEGDLGHPNLLVPLSKSVCEQKVRLLQQCFASQLSKPWFQPETFWATLWLRGLEAKADSGLAEAFTCRKLIL